MPKRIEELMRLGASSIKTDFGEGIPAEAVYANIHGDAFTISTAWSIIRVVASAIRRVTGERRRSGAPAEPPVARDILFIGAATASAVLPDWQEPCELR